jgi:hypothetical protein
MSVEVPYPVFTDRNGEPLENGYVWVGTANLNPQTNPIQVYFDRDLTQPAQQPLRTIAGYVSNAGTPSQIYINGNNYSILVQDKNGTMVYNFASGTGIEPIPNDACGLAYTPNFPGSVTRPTCEKLEELISVKDFGAVGDGVADDTATIQSAINAATAVGKNLYVPKGTYNLTAQLQVTCGIVGDGSSQTLFQGLNNGTSAGILILVTNGNLFEGFTVDGACSADPSSWNNSNFDSFTGWRPFFMSGVNNAAIQDVIGQNSALGAPIRIESCQNILVENCQAIRGRGNFGDGFYTRRSRRVDFVNCRAFDVTRIGFVCEGTSGGSILVCEQVTYTNCHAEFAHDQSVNYGGGEFNAGFWFENSTLNTCIGCTTKNTGDRGFTFAGTNLVRTAGFSVSQAAYINCHADTAGIGFNCSSLSSSIEAIVTYDNCATKSCTRGFGGRRSTVTINNGSYFQDSGGNQTRAITTETESVVFVNGFYEEWTNKPAEDLSNTSDTASVSTFSTEAPRQVVIDGYRTYNDAYFTVKYRTGANRNTLDLTIKNSIIRSPIANAKTVNIDNCTIEQSQYLIANKFSADNLLVTGNMDTFLYTDNSYATISNSKFERLLETNRLRIFNESNTTEKPKYFINNCSFVGNVETGSNLVNVNTATALASTARCADIVVNGCTFFNTGGSTTNPAIVLTRGSGISTVYGTSNWKSATLTNLATRTASGSTTANLL